VLLRCVFDFKLKGAADRLVEGQIAWNA